MLSLWETCIRGQRSVWRDRVDQQAFDKLTFVAHAVLRTSEGISLADPSRNLCRRSAVSWVHGPLRRRGQLSSQPLGAGGQEAVETPDARETETRSERERSPPPLQTRLCETLLWDKIPRALESARCSPFASKGARTGGVRTGLLIMSSRQNVEEFSGSLQEVWNLKISRYECFGGRSFSFLFIST